LSAVLSIAVVATVLSAVEAPARASEPSESVQTTTPPTSGQQAGPVNAPEPLTEVPAHPSGVPTGLPEGPAEPEPQSVYDGPAGSGLLHQTGDPNWPIVADSGAVVVRFGSSAAHLVEIVMPEGRAILSATTTIDIGTPRMDGDGVVFDDIATDTDLRFDVGPAGVTQRLVIGSAAGLHELELFLADPDGALTGMTDLGDGGYELGSGDQTRLSVTPAYAYESVSPGTGFMHEPGSAHQSVVMDDGGYVVRNWVDEAWLDTHAYPIELDPDFAVVAAGTASGGRFNPMTMDRALDTRTGLGLGAAAKVPANSGSVTIYPKNTGSVPATGVAAVVLHVVPINPAAAGTLAVYPAGVTATSPSSVTFATGKDSSNTAIVKLGTSGGVTVYNRSPQPLDVAVDVTGWFSTVDDSASGGMLQLVTPTRVFDTRQPGTGGILGGPDDVAVPIAGLAGLPTNVAEMASVIVNVTAVTPSVASYFTVWPTGATMPVYSSMNFETNTMSSLVTTKIGSNGSISIFNPLGTVHALVEIIGYYTPQDAGGFSPYTTLTPARIVDTRSAAGTARTTPLPNNTTESFTVLGRGGIPTSNVAAVAINVTTLDPTANAYVNVFDGDFTEPTVSTIQTQANQNRQNLVIVQPAADGTVDVRTHGTSTHILVDVLGWFAVPRYAPTVQWQIVGTPTGPQGAFSAGQGITARMTVQNHDPAFAVTVNASVTEPTNVTISAPTRNGVACTAPTVCVGASATGSASIRNASLAVNATTQVDFPLEVASLRGCTTFTLAGSQALVSAVYQDGSEYFTHPAPDLSASVCDGGLGFEPWWSYDQRSIGSGGTASVNIGNGNLVVQQLDSTTIQAHGRLAFVVRRTYNSQDSNLLGLPGSLGSGWTLNVGQLTTGSSALGAGLHVPSLETAVSPGAITLIDRDGTKHLFEPRSVSPMLLAPAATPIAAGGIANALAPQSLTMPVGYPTLCIDQRYAAPAGVHLSLWRYIAITTTGTNACAAAGSAPSSAVVVGYAAMRPDRLRTEYDALGRLRSMLDGTGNELAYSYPGGAVQLQVTESRAGTTARTMVLATAAATTGCGSNVTSALDLTDAADRVTRYCQTGTTTKYLTRVVNPDGSTLDYRYQGIARADGVAAATCSGFTGQLCATTDARGSATSFTYADVAGGPTMTASMRAVTAVTDRRGKVTQLDYQYGASSPYVNANRTDMDPANPSVVRSRQRVRYSAIDSSGRVQQVDEGSPAASAPNDPALIDSLRQTMFGWDSGSTTCNTHEPHVDNLLCGTTRKTLLSVTQPQPGFGFSPDDVTDYLYDREGALVRTRRNTNAGQTPNERLDSTVGYRTQFVTATGVYCWDDRVSSGGTITPQSATCTGASGPAGSGRGAGDPLFYLADRIEALTPNGNADTTNWAQYRTTYVVDNDVTKSPNARPTVSTKPCPAPTTTTGNTGLICRTDAPRNGGQRATTDQKYDEYGQRTHETRPNGGTQQYVYYADTDNDLSGTTSAGGWLKAVIDPTQMFVAFAYDAAGNVVRTWDRNSTASNTVASVVVPYTSYPGSTTAPPNGNTRYVEDEYNELTVGAVKFAKPWRFVVSHKNQVGATTTSTVDANGNVLTATTPTGLTTTSTYGASDNLDTMTVPKPAYISTAATTTYHVDDYGRPDAGRDPNQNVTSTMYDVVNRKLGTWRVRGPESMPFASPGCSASAGMGLTWIASGLRVCPVGQVQYFDGVDRVYMYTTGQGFYGRKTYDGAGRLTIDTMPRQTWAHTQYRYDADGHQLRACSARSVAESGGWTECDGFNAYGTTTTYDTAGRMRTSTTHHVAPGGTAGTSTARTTTYDYDANGNTTSVTGPVSGRPATTVAYDALDRKVCEERPRSHGASTDFNRQVTTYDAIGNVISISRFVDGQCSSTATIPTTSTTTYTYDAANRRTDTIDTPSGSGTPVTGGTDVHTRVDYDADGRVVATYEPRAFAPGAPPLTSTPYLVRTTYDGGGRPAVQYVPRSGGTDAPEPTLTRPGGSPITTQADDCPQNAPGYASSTNVCRTALIYDVAGRVVTQWLGSAATSHTASSTAVPTKGTSGRSARYVNYTYTPDGLVATTDAAAPAGSGASRVLTRRYYDGSGAAVAEGGPRFDPDDAVQKYLDLTTTSYFGDGQVQTRSSAAGVPATSTTTASLLHDESYSYDANGSVITQTAPSGIVTTNTYFTDGLKESTKTPSSRYGMSGSTPGYDAFDKTSYEYDAAGNVTNVWSPSANAAGTALADATQSTRTSTVTTYTDDNLVASVLTPIAQNGDTVGSSTFRQQTYSYDDAGRKTSVSTGTVTLTGTNPRTYAASGNTQAQSFAYYANDRLQTETGNDASTISHGYDDAGLETSTTSSVNSGANVTSTYYYDGRPRTVDSQDRRTTYAFDGLGNEVAHDLRTVSSSVAAPGTTATTYGDAGAPVEVTAPAASAGSTGDLGAGRYTWAYDVAGRLTTETAPNAAQSIFSWANDDTLTSREVRKSATDTTVLSKWSYTYDTGYREVSHTFNGLDGSTVSPVTTTYTYAPGGRLASFANGSTPTKYVTWDHNGNRTCYGVDCDHGSVHPTGNDHVAFNYLADNSIKSEESAGNTFTYPSANPTGGLTADRCNNYSYDGFDRLTDMTPTGASGCGTTGTTYAYDPLDRQVSRTAGSGTPQLIHYLGRTGTADRTTVGSAATDVAVDANARPLALRDATNTQYLTDNGRGSIGSVLSTTSTVACQAAYDPFGSQLGAAGTSAATSCTSTATPNDRWYNAARRDETTGNYQLGSRTYDPTKASFLMPDTYRAAGPAVDAALGTDPLTANRYGYVNGDPVNLVDPTGHIPAPRDEPPCNAECQRMIRLAELVRKTMINRIKRTHRNIFQRALGGISDAVTGYEVTDMVDSILRAAEESDIDPFTLFGILSHESSLRQHIPGSIVLERGGLVPLGVAGAKNTSLGIGNMQRGAFIETAEKHPELLGGDEPDEWDWANLADDNGLAIRAAAFHIADLQKRLRAQVEARTSSTAYSAQQLIAIGYTAGASSMISAYKTGDRYADTYARNFDGWYDDARHYLCGGGNFKCE
jgi:RHS repeat-associated protein